MRSENISRLSSININKFSYFYLHYKSFHKDLFQAINSHASGRVLDIGCGNKPYEKVFEGKITEYIGCDIVQSDQNKVDVICEATNIPLPDQSFDTVISTQTIEHVADHQKLVTEAWRLLKPGGKFILSGPLTWPLHEEPYDFFRFTKHGFKYVVENAGFEVLEIISNGGMWAAAGQQFLIAVLNPAKKSNLLIRFWRKTFTLLRMHFFTNLIYGWLDEKDKNYVNTINYVIVGKK